MDPVTPPSEPHDTTDTTDEQIDNLLREVEELKASSPIKPKTERDAMAEDVLLKTEVLQPTPKDSPKESEDDGDGIEEEEHKTVYSTTPDTTTTNPTTTTTIPKSVSQALFTSSVKVMKVRDKTTAPKFIGMKPKDEESPSTLKIAALQQREKELSIKTRKLRKEIDYLKDLIDTASVSSNLSELRKLKYAIERLEGFLDQKEKEKYEVGIQLTRSLRKRVDSGDYGEFWST